MYRLTPNSNSHFLAVKTLRVAIYVCCGRQFIQLLYV